MSTQGIALRAGLRRHDEFKERTARDRERLARAKAKWERREAVRAQQQQMLLRAAFYERHPELAA